MEEKIHHPLESFLTEARKQAINRKSFQHVTLRESLKQLRDECERGLKKGCDPLELFPREIWTMVSVYLDSNRDLVNWSKTCTLFGHLLKFSTAELLFAKVIPMISFAFDQKDILACRLVCQSWKKGIDQLLVNYWNQEYYNDNAVEKLVLDRPKFMMNSDEVDKFTVYVSFPLPVNDNDNFEMNLVWPGFASVQFETGHPDVIKQYKEYLSKIAGFVQHLEIDDDFVAPEENPVEYGNEEEEEEAEDHEELTVKDLLLLCQQSLETCTNLKIFTIWECAKVKWDKITENSIISAPSFPQQPFLQDLSFGIDHKKSLFILDELLTKYSGQLESLSVKNWNLTLNTTLNWNCLRNLRVAKVCSNRILKSIANINAPNLTSLSLRFTGTVNLIHVLETQENFPKLNTLELILSNKHFLPTSNEISQIPTSLSNNNVQNLIIRTNLQTANYDFLVCFPLMKILALIPNEDDKCENLKVVESVENNDCFIKLNEYLMPTRSTNSLYDSNVWALFPQLDTVKVADRFFTRAYYNWKRKIPAEKLRQLLKPVHLEAFQKSNRRCHTESTKMKSQLRNKLLITSESLRTSKKDITDQVFEILLPFLTKPTTLICRAVCTAWKNAIDIIVSKRSNPSFTHRFTLPFQTTGSNEIENRLELMNQHSENPFVGKSVNFCISRPEDDPFHVNLLVDATFLLRQVGHHILHLQLTSQGKNMLAIDTIEILALVFAYCDNLQSLDLRSLKILAEPTRTEPLGSSSGYFNKQPNFTTFLAGNLPPCFDEIQYELLNQYEGQLKTVQLSSRRHAYNRKFTYEMATLKELGMPIEEPSEEYPTRFQNPNLRKLQLFVDSTCGQHWLYTNYIAQQINDYQNLTELKLYFYDNYKSSSFINTGYLDPHEVFKVLRLKIIVGYKYQISFDFLLRFPFLKKLEIIIGDWATDWYNNHLSIENGNNKLEWQPILEDVYDHMNNVKEAEHNPVDKASGKDERKNDLVPLAQYIGDENVKDKQVPQLCLYDSNVWTVLPKLQKLQIIQGASDNGRKTAHKFYTRAHKEYQQQIRNVQK